MREARLNAREWRLQRLFSKRLFLLAFLLAFVLLLESSREDARPDRVPRPPATALIDALPLPPPEPIIGGLWELRSPEVRFGALSGLTWDDRALVAVTDSGVVIRWRPPAGAATFRDLPDGPGPPRWKVHRDAEAITRDWRGRGWWVTFEQFHGAWLFDQHLTRALGVRPVQVRTAWRNWGVEAALSREDGLLLLPENGREAILLKDRGERRTALQVAGSIADAVDVAPGVAVLAVRVIRPWGIRNRLAWLTGDGPYRVTDWVTLPLGRWDNVEGLAVEPLAGGGQRLWFVTDNDRSRRTLLGWVSVPAIPALAGTSGT